MKLQAEEANAAMKENMAAYGGELGNIFEGKGNKPNQLKIAPDGKSWARRVLGDGALTDFIEDPIDYVAGDQIDAALSKIGDMTEPQLEKFFKTSIGQRVAQFLVDTDGKDTSNYIEAGTFPGKKAAKLWSRAHKSAVNIAKKSLADVRKGAGKNSKQSSGTALVKAS